MITLNLLNDWAKDLKPILFDINVSLNNIRILEHKRMDKFRTNYWCSYSTLLYQQHFILVIQLEKIFSKNNKTQQRNINKLFSIIQNECLAGDVLSYKNSTHNFKSKKDILAAIKELKEKMDKSSVIIDSIKELRDKVYAHTDPEDTKESITFDKLAILVDLSCNIYNTLIGDLLDDEFKPIIVKQYDFRSFIDLLER